MTSGTGHAGRPGWRRGVRPRKRNRYCQFLFFPVVTRYRVRGSLILSPTTPVETGSSPGTADNVSPSLFYAIWGRECKCYLQVTQGLRLRIQPRRAANGQYRVIFAVAEVVPVGPVSYTHLDVYKRQVLCFRAAPVLRQGDVPHRYPQALQNVLRGASCQAVQHNALFTHADRQTRLAIVMAGAVSYTPLDVYKRQLLANTSTSGLRAPSWLVQYSAMDATRGVLPLPLPTTISAFLCLR